MTLQPGRHKETRFKLIFIDSTGLEYSKLEFKDVWGLLHEVMDIIKFRYDKAYKK